MADYMYLMAKLPYLGIFPPSSPIDILLEDYPEFNKDIKTPLKTLYNEFLTELADEILKIRSGSNHIPRLFNEHLISMNPLEREKTLLTIKWKYLDNISPSEPNNDWLWIYKEKVMLINHFQSFDSEIGFSNYKTLIEEVLKNASKQDGA